MNYKTKKHATRLEIQFHGRKERFNQIAVEIIPRAKRYYIPGYLWHITHRCYQQEFLLKFARDRRGYRYGLHETKKDLASSGSIAVITSNHIHLN